MVQVAAGVKVGSTVHVATGVKVAAGVQVTGRGLEVDVAAAATMDAGAGEAGAAHAASSKASTIAIVVCRLIHPIVLVCIHSPPSLRPIIAYICTKDQFFYDKSSTFLEVVTILGSQPRTKVLPWAR